MRCLPLILAGLVLGAGIGFAQQTPETAAITLQGKGECTTRAFTFQNNWHIESAADSGIKIQAIPTDGSAPITLIDLPTTTPPAPSYTGTSVPVPRGGSYTLEVSSTGRWQITALENGFTKNLSFGTATPYSPTANSPGNPAVPGLPGMTPSSMSFPTSRTIAILSGMGPMTTRQFTVNNGWELQWTAFGPVKITLVPADGSSPTMITDSLSNGGLDEPIPSPTPTTPPVSNYPNPYGGMASNVRHGTSHQATGGDFTLQVEGKMQWSVRVAQVDPNGPQVAASSFANPGSSTNPTAPTTPANATPAPIVKLTDEQVAAVVLIKGDNSEGTGFLVKTPDGPVVVTNIHVIADNPNIKITTNTGAVIPMLSAKGASDRDLAELSIKDAGYSYLTLSPDISKTAQNGDEVVTPGNSLGGEVMLNTGGKVLGIGPKRIEIDNPIYHGNSGGPIFHTKSGQVLGVVTEGMKVDTSNQLDHNSFASQNSAITGSMRYFGMRLDNVPNWIPIDWNLFQTETVFLAQFHLQSQRLDSYLNTSDSDPGEYAHLYRGDEKIMKSNETYVQNLGTDGRVAALKALVFDLQGIADKGMGQIQVLNNFYSFDQERAQEEIEFRNALKKELDSIGDDADRLKGRQQTN